MVVVNVVTIIVLNVVVVDVVDLNVDVVVVDVVLLTGEDTVDLTHLVGTRMKRATAKLDIHLVCFEYLKSNN